MVLLNVFQEAVYVAFRMKNLKPCKFITEGTLSPIENQATRTKHQQQDRLRISSILELSPLEFIKYSSANSAVI